MSTLHPKDDRPTIVLDSQETLTEVFEAICPHEEVRASSPSLLVLIALPNGELICPMAIDDLPADVPDSDKQQMCRNLAAAAAELGGGALAMAITQPDGPDAEQWAAWAQALDTAGIENGLRSLGMSVLHPGGCQHLAPRAAAAHP